MTHYKHTQIGHVMLASFGAARLLVLAMPPTWRNDRVSHIVAGILVLYAVLFAS